MSRRNTCDKSGLHQAAALPNQSGDAGRHEVETLMYAVLSLPAAASAVAWLRVEWLAEHALEW